MIFVCGDSHGNFGPIFDWINEAQKGDSLVHVGDLGVSFVDNKFLEMIGNSAKEKEVDILAIRGNHDGPKPFQENKIYGNLELIPDYSVKKIGHRKFLFIGGAISIDRLWRTQGLDYWKDEKVIYDLSLIDKVEGVDVLITHTCPIFLNPVRGLSNIQWALDKDKSLFKDLQEERIYMEQVWNKLKEKNNITKYYYGHFHVSKTEFFETTKFRCLDIDEIVMV